MCDKRQNVAMLLIGLGAMGCFSWRQEYITTETNGQSFGLGSGLGFVVGMGVGLLIPNAKNDKE